MATKIYHGPPGSYKSSSAVWFEIVPALRLGRVVVTNVQGCKTLEEMQMELKEVFPESARLLRISIGNDTGLMLIRNFFHWLPIGSMIFLDEIQDIYPNDKSFKATDYDYKKEGFFDDKLPQDFIEIYHKEQRQIKTNVDISDYLDDLGESLFDERDYLRYPRTLRECFMRHRHYNWDILLATPDIKEVSAFVRSVCEVAYCYSSKDAIPIPYYKRRPRILEHLPKTNGISVGKNDIVKFRKVPKDVFKLYKSTATGKNTQSGAGQSPFTWRLIAGFAFVIAYVVYMVFFFFDDDSAEVSQAELDNSSFQVSSSQKVKQENKAANTKNNEIHKKGRISLDDVVFRDVSVSVVTSDSNFIKLPFNAHKMYVNAVNTVYFNKYKVARDYVFTVYIGDDILNVGSESLLSMGYQIFYKSNCLVELRTNEHSSYIYCEPTKSLEPFNSSHSVTDISLLGD